MQIREDDLRTAAERAFASARTALDRRRALLRPFKSAEGTPDSHAWPSGNGYRQSVRTLNMARCAISLSVGPE